MKNNTVKIIQCLLAVTLLVSCARESWRPAWFEDDRRVEYREVPTRGDGRTVSSISKKEARADLDLFRYLIETSYAGYEYQKEIRKVDFGRNFLLARWHLFRMKGRDISREDMYRLIFTALKGVQDGHLFIDGLYHPYTHENFYHSGITVSKREKDLVVSASSVDGISPGDRYRDSEAYLFRMYAPDGESYRIGALSSRPISELSLKIGEARLKVPVTLDMDTVSVPKDEILYSHDDGVTFLRIPNFSAMGQSALVTDEGKERHKEVVRHIRLLDKGETVIIDLRNNPGGYIDTAAFVPAILFKRQTKNFMPKSALLESPGIAQARVRNVWDMGVNDNSSSDSRKADQIAADNQRVNPMRKWSLNIWREEAVKKVENTRKIIVIVNRVSASASEMMCEIRSIPGVTIIGENSSGIMSFANNQQYCLPNSRINLLIPTELYFDLSYSAGEGTGVLPDYWVLHDELEGVLRSLTGRESFKMPEGPAPK